MSDIATVSLPGLDGRLGADQQTALKDLIQSASFKPDNDNNGPYDLTLSSEEGRLIVKIRNTQGNELPALILSLSPYRRIIHDYFLMIEGYEESRRTATSCRLEAIDMGRRGLHNEGAEMMIDRLRGKIEMDFETARRLFTLICALQKPSVRS